MSRLSAPAIVGELFEAFDRCDPTRSREVKPSERARERAAMRRVIRACLLLVVPMIGLLLFAAGVAS